MCIYVKKNILASKIVYEIIAAFMEFYILPVMDKRRDYGRVCGMYNICFAVEGG